MSNTEKEHPYKDWDQTNEWKDVLVRKGQNLYRLEKAPSLS